jgi:4-amino-4-deoxy-L-arabinose transferase-like glycosyltransferase
MSILLILICFILIFFSLGVLAASRSKKDILLYTVLVFCLIILCGTEALSAIHCINYIPLLIYWLFITLAAAGYLYLQRDKLNMFSASLWLQAGNYYKSLNLFEKALSAGLLVLLLMVFVQGVAYPPTNYDSMTYHLARITSWIGHHSVSYYPTDITRQIYQPPFAEYMILHFNLLARNDCFSASVQFIFLLFSIIAINAIAAHLGLGRKARLFAMIIAATIPEVVLQGSSTQNDIVESFFILAAFYFMLKAINSARLKYFLFLGLAAGFSLLTKGTGYVYLFPVLLVFGIIILVRLLKTRNYFILVNSLLALLLIVIINSGYYIRNYRLAHNLLGIDKTEARVYSNERMDPGLLMSAIAKNASLHMELMFAIPVSLWADSGITELHKAARININDPAVNYRGIKFSLNNDVTNEDNAPNFFHLLLIISSIIIAIVFLGRVSKDLPAVWLIIIILLQIVLFCAYLKWQPWNSRLHTPVFLLAAPFIAYAFSLTSGLFKTRYLIAPILLVYALLVSLHNDTRPVNGKIFNEPRYKKYFAGKPDDYAEYNGVNNLVRQNKFKNIGLIVGVDDWEYPLFVNCYSMTIVPVYIAVDNLTKSCDTANRAVDCIISTKVNTPFIDYDKRRYYNQDKGNNIIHLYK